MKIQTSVRSIYEDLHERYSKLEPFIQKFFEANKEKGWHFEGRIKSEESFALKVETGRVKDILSLDDFYACTLVVKDTNKISIAESIVSKRFDVVERRPKKSKETNTWPSNFIFDDLRLIVKWSDSGVIKPSGLDGVLFEVQIKTFLEHAWSIATHDTIYKSDSVNWGKERLASQLRAMLNHAQLAIEESDALASSSIIDLEYKKYVKINAVIELLREKWEVERLPKDLKRLSESVLNVLNFTNISIEKLSLNLDEAAKNGRGHRLKNLSPYNAIIQTIVDFNKEKIIGTGSKKWKSAPIVIFPEIEFANLSELDGKEHIVVVGD